MAFLGFGKKKEEKSTTQAKVEGVYVDDVSQKQEGDMTTREALDKGYITREQGLELAKRTGERDRQLTKDAEAINKQYEKSSKSPWQRFKEGTSNVATSVATTAEAARGPTVQAGKDVVSVLAAGGGSRTGVYPYKTTKSGQVLYKQMKGGSGSGSLNFLSTNASVLNQSDKIKQMSWLTARQGSVVSSVGGQAQHAGQATGKRYQLVTSKSGRQYYRLMAQSPGAAQMQANVSAGSQLMQVNVPQYANKAQAFLARDEGNPYYQKSQMLTFPKRQDEIPFSQKAAAFISQPRQQSFGLSPTDKIKRMLR